MSWLEPRSKTFPGVNMGNGESGSGDDIGIMFVETHCREGHPVTEVVYYSIWDTPYLA